MLGGLVYIVKECMAVIRCFLAFVVEEFLVNVGRFLVYIFEEYLPITKHFLAYIAKKRLVTSCFSAYISHFILRKNIDKCLAATRCS
jgi:hypothetical protein